MIKMVNVKTYIKKEVKRRCPYCHNDMMIKKGLSSENIKRLFRKPTLEDFIVLVILFLAIGSFLIYTYEIKAHRAYIDANCPIGQQDEQGTGIYLPEGLYGVDNATVDNNSDIFFKLNNTSQPDEKG